MSDPPLASFVVVPCLNEHESLETTCRSLGFAAGLDPPDGCALVLVDNGSTDGTVELCEAIRDASRAQVILARERERGYVPARRRGVEVAGTLSSELGVAPDDVVVVQADADTQYSPGYVIAMRDALHLAGPGHLAHATTTRPHTFADQHRLVVEIGNSDQVDVDDSQGREFDVIVDDKACAFTLGDYRRWGGHRREYMRDGEELLAETSRLFISARVRGATRIDVDAATASHSLRRLESDAAQELASVGFPYASRRLVGSERVTLAALDERVAAGDRAILEQIRVVRRAHLVGLLRVLPAHVARSAGLSLADGEVREALDSLPPRQREEVVAHPGRLLADVLDLIADGSDGPMSSMLTRN